MRVRTLAASGLALCVALAASPLTAVSKTEVSHAAEPTLDWIRTGGPIGGMGYDIRMKPGDSSRMYVTDAYAGVFRSDDFGRTWAPSNEGILVSSGESGDGVPVFCLTIDPNLPDTIWIGTQAVRGVYRSDDGGSRWTEKVQGIAEADGITFRGFTVDPRDSSVVYGAAEISSFVWAGAERRGREFDMVKGVVYKTTDGGDHWEPVWRGDNLARYIWLDPRNPDVVYVSTGIFDREAANSDPVAGKPGAVGVIKSTDGGRTWNAMTRGMINLYVGSLFMHPDNPDILLAGTGNNQYRQGAGIYVSKDGGANWRRTLATFDAITAVEFSLSDPRIAYAGSVSAIYRSADGGNTWRTMTPAGLWGPPGVAAGFPIDFQVDPRNPNRLYANNYGGGNFLSTDAGRTWAEASHGYTGAQVRAIAVDRTSPGKAYLAARSGLFASVNGGGAWSGVGYSPANVTEANALAIDPVGGSHLVAGTSMNEDLFVSYDGGSSWRVTAHLNPNLAWRAVAFSAHDPRVVYAGTGGYFSAGVFSNEMPAAGTYVSSDGGLTWRKPQGSYSDANVAALATDATDSQRVFAATSNYGVLRSSDGGRTWARLGNGLPTNPPAALSIALGPDNSNVILAGYEGAGVYRSRDGGQSWQRTSAGLEPEALVSSVVFSPEDPQIVYAADRRAGVYRSSDGGTTWSPLGAALGFRSVNALALSSDALHLYAATEGGGVYRLDLNGSPPEPYRVAPPAALSRPRPSRTLVPRSGSLSVSGAVRPGHATAGTMTCEKLVAGRWKTVGSYTRRWISSVGGAFKVTYRLPAGKYRFTASHGSSASTSCHLRGSSAVSASVTVR